MVKITLLAISLSTIEVCFKDRRLPKEINKKGRAELALPSALRVDDRFIIDLWVILLGSFLLSGRIPIE